MARIECPRCGSVAAAAVRRVYCASCGWNRESAEERLQGELAQAPRVSGFLAVTLFLSFLVFGISWMGLSVIAMIAGLSILVAFEYRRLQMALRELTAQTPRAPRKPAVKVQERMAAEQRRLDEHNEYVRYLPRPPRRVRMSRDFRFLQAIFFLPMVAVLGGFFIHYLRDPYGGTDWQDWIFLSLPIALGLVGLNVLRQKRGIRKLLVRGDAATGWVIKQSEVETGGRWKRSEIGYEFKNAIGRLCEGRSTDPTDSVRAGMLVVVLYDPEDLHNSMAYCGGPYEIVRRGKK